MTQPIAYGVAIACLVVAVFAGLHMVRDARFSNPLFYAMAVLEIVFVAMLIGGVIALSTTSRDVNGVLFISYLVTVVLIPPAAVVWGVSEKSRWGTGVVTVAMLSNAVLCVRLLQIWQGTIV